MSRRIENPSEQEVTSAPTTTQNQVIANVGAAALASIAIWHIVQPIIETFGN